MSRGDEERNARIHSRATAYAMDEMSRLRASGRVTGNDSAPVVTEADLARAFVIGYAAGLEDGRSAVGRRTVRK